MYILGLKGRKFMVMHKKTFSVDVNDELSESFSKMVEERGYTKYRAFEAAMRAFLVLTPEIQVKLMSNSADAYNLIRDSFRDLALKDDLDSLPEKQRNQILALAKEVARQVSRKR